MAEGTQEVEPTGLGVTGMKSCRKQPKQEELALFPRWPRAKPHRLSESEVKALVRFRDGYRCRECGMTAKEHHRRFHRSLEVHRIVPGSRYTIRGCVTLCRKCHFSKPKSERGTGSSDGYRTITFRVPGDLRDRIVRAATDRRLTPNIFIRMVVLQNLEEYAARLGVSAD